ncbi:MAG: hypothetical protein H7Y38_09245 [Armatimonadetes bacterium]|nr:hypothetical protein [Armatimonadota bacterium]
MKTGWLVGAGFALTLGAVARMATAPAVATPPVPAPVAYGDAFLRTSWTVSVPGATGVHLAPNGKSAAWTDANGCVRRINTGNGRTVWRTSPLAGVNRVVVGAGGDVAAFSGLNPERNSVVLLDADTGDKKTRVFAGNGAVWSAAFGSKTVFAAQTVFVGTGGRIVYAFRAVPSDKPRFLAAGIPDDLAVSADGSRLAFATWSPASVNGCAVAGSGTPWRFPEKPGRRARVSVSANGARVMALSTRGARGESGVVRIHDGATGKLVGQVMLPANATEPTAVFAANGESVAATYCVRKGDARDWRLAYFDAKGRRFFAPMGSALFKPHIVAVSANGNTLTVQDGDATFFTLDRRGNFLSRLRLQPEAAGGKPVRVLDALASDDGKTILLRLRGDKLALLRAGS